ncbi:MAG: ATP-binding protein [Chloroflexota bacterium]
MAMEPPPRHRREELQLLAVREILRAIGAALPIDEILAVIANVAIIVFDASTSWFMLVEDGTLRTAVARGEFASRLAGRSCRIGAKNIVISRGLHHPIIVQPQDIRPTDPIVGIFAKGAEAVVLLPLKSGDRLTGLLGSTVTPEASLEISFLITLAEQASTAIETAHLRQETRTWRERLDAVFDRLVEPVLIFDRDGRLALMNDSAAEVLRDKHICLGDPLDQFVAKAGLRDPNGRLLPAKKTAMARALQGQRVENFEQDVLMPDGAVRHLLASAVPIRSNHRVQGAVAVWRDITYIREIERMRAEFLSMVSHELRTPLTSISGYAQVLQRDQLKDRPLREFHKPLAAIVDQINRVSVLVEDLLDASRAEVGRLALKVTRVDLEGLIRKTVADTASLAPQHRFELKLPDTIPPVAADPGRVEQVLRNILGNAVKFSDPGTKVTIGVKVEKDQVIVSVSDQGPGIAREDIPLLFLPFHRVHRVGGREVKGVGLGLFISRSIVEALGGEIWVRSQLGKGSTFSFSLPRA